jgi:hypothetical protein
MLNNKRQRSRPPTTEHPFLPYIRIRHPPDIDIRIDLALWFMVLVDCGPTLARPFPDKNLQSTKHHQ